MDVLPTNSGWNRRSAGTFNPQARARTSEMEGSLSAKPKSEAVQSLRDEQRKQRRENHRTDADRDLETGLEDSFPASDPVAPVTPTQAGSPKTRKS